MTCVVWPFLTADHITGPVLLEQYVAIADYKKQNRNEVNMVAGDIVEVIDKNENGTANIIFLSGSIQFRLCVCVKYVLNPDED